MLEKTHVNVQSEIFNNLFERVFADGDVLILFFKSDDNK